MGTVDRKEAPTGPRSEPPQGGRYITLAEVEKRNTDKETWIVLHGRVYDITSFLGEVGAGGQGLC